MPLRAEIACAGRSRSRPYGGQFRHYLIGFDSDKSFSIFHCCFLYYLWLSCTGYKTCGLLGKL